MKKNKHAFILLCCVGVLLTGQAIYGESPDTLQLYLDGRFNEIIQYFKANEFRIDFKALTFKDKLLYIECLARTAQGREALVKLDPLLANQEHKIEVMATAAIVHFSLGQFSRAREYLDQVLELPGGAESRRVMVTGILWSLYNRQFQQALEQYQWLLKRDSLWGESDLMFILGLDIYRALGDITALGGLYKTHAGRKRNRTDKRLENLQADAKMYKKAGSEKMFRVETNGDKVVVPFSNLPGNVRVNTITFTINNKSFNVLLDTGNASGWTVHSRELRDLLKSRQGSRTLTKIGVVSGLLDGFRYFFKKVDFNHFVLLDADGGYVPKPYKDFPDANLNPLFICNRVVTLDFKTNEMVLRSSERFQQDLQVMVNSAPQGKISVSRLPWWGYKDALVKVAADGHEGLGLLETGAEDIALKKDFVQDWNLPLLEKQRFLANGAVFKYFLTPIVLQLGDLVFRRPTAEVWPLDRFYHPITGLAPDVVLGPFAFTHLSISFDPFANEVVVIKQ